MSVYTKDDSSVSSRYMQNCRKAKLETLLIVAPRPQSWRTAKNSIVVITSASRTEDLGFESRQGSRFLGLYTLQCCCQNLICTFIVCIWKIKFFSFCVNGSLGCSCWLALSCFARMHLFRERACAKKVKHIFFGFIKARWEVARI
jgi:hypothetical protein